MSKLKLAGKIAYWLILTTLLTVAGLVALSSLEIPGNYRLMTVLSGSMEPTIHTGSVAVIKPANNYQVGDIISYRDKVIVTHRIYAATDSAFITKGDANNTPDATEVFRSQIIGKYLFSVPRVGFLVGFAKTQQGFLILVIIPAVIIVYNEILTIKNELKKMLCKK